MLSHIWLFVTPWIIAFQVSLSMDFSRQEYWGELPFPTPGDLPHLGIEPISSELADRSYTTVPPGKHLEGIKIEILIWLRKWKSLSHVWLFVTSPASLPPTHGLYSLWNSPGQNTGVGSHSLLQGIFPTQGSNPGLPHCRQILYQLSHREAQTIP